MFPFIPSCAHILFILVVWGFPEIKQSYHKIPLCAIPNTITDGFQQIATSDSNEIAMLIHYFEEDYNTRFVNEFQKCFLDLP